MFSIKCHDTFKFELNNLFIIQSSETLFALSLDHCKIFNPRYRRYGFVMTVTYFTLNSSESYPLFPDVLLLKYGTIQL